jgi:hypothetical protein
MSDGYLCNLIISICIFTRKGICMSTRYATIAIIATIFVAIAIQSRSQGDDSDPMQQYSRQQQEYDRQMAKNRTAFDKDIKQREEAWMQAKQQQQKEAELQVRFEKLLGKWEEQAQRFDRILDAMENNNSTEKHSNFQQGCRGSRSLMIHRCRK